MNNESRLWMARGLLFICSIVDSWALGKLYGAQGDSSGVKFWFGVFMVVLALNVPAYFYYRKVKAVRDIAKERKDDNQIEVEMLAAYAKQEHEKQMATEKKTAAPPTTKPKDD